MMQYVRVLFLSGLLIAAGPRLAFSADNPVGLETLCHAGVGVSDFPRALKFYIKVLGLKEAFRVNRADGSPSYIYLQVADSDTFVELKYEASPHELNAYHMGFVVRDLPASLRALQARGYALPADAFQKAAQLAKDGTHYYFIQDPDGNRIELSQLTPEALQIKAAPALLQLTDSSHAK